VSDGALLVTVDASLSLRPLRRTVILEATLATVVLAITAALVVIRPGG
jgi:hypothetical protein